MPGWLASFWSSDSRAPVIAAIVGGVVVALLILFFLYRLLFGNRLRVPSAGRARQPRLGLVDAFWLDGQRQLVLVRRDSVEHLIMIGGPNDVLVESQIIRVAGPASATLRDREAQPAKQPPAAAGAARRAASAPLAPTPLPANPGRPLKPAAIAPEPAPPVPPRAPTPAPVVAPEPVREPTVRRPDPAPKPPERSPEPVAAAPARSSTPARPASNPVAPPTPVAQVPPPQVRAAEVRAAEVRAADRRLGAEAGAGPPCAIARSSAVAPAHRCGGLLVAHVAFAAGRRRSAQTAAVQLAGRVHRAEGPAACAGASAAVPGATKIRGILHRPRVAGGRNGAVARA